MLSKSILVCYFIFSKFEGTMRSIHSYNSTPSKFLTFTFFIFQVTVYRDEVLQYLRNIARSSNQIHLDQNIATLRRSKVWKVSAQLQKYFNEFWGLHLEVKYFYSDL